MNALPQMSLQEASWHQHLAGMRAAEAARKQGADPAAVAAIATATAGPVNIGGFLLQAASQGTIWTLQRAAREFGTWADKLGIPHSPDPEKPGTRELLELGISTLIFCDARACWLELETGKLEQLISRADDLMWSLEISAQAQLQQHFQSEMQRLGSLSPTEEDQRKKSQTAVASGISPATPIPAVATASPLSSGSPQNTEFPTPMPFGTLALPSP